MDLVSLLVATVVFALVMSLLTILPMDAGLKRVLSIAVVALFLLWLLATFMPGIAHMRFG